MLAGSRQAPPTTASPGSPELLPTFENALGKDHPHVSYVLAELAEVELASGNAESARVYAERSLASRKDEYGDDHPVTAASRDLIARIETGA